MCCNVAHERRSPGVCVGSPAMSYEIRIEDRPAVSLASVRKEIPQDQLGVWIDDALGQVFPALGAAGLTQTGSMVCRYHTWADGRTDCEVGFPISGTAPAGLTASSTPAGRSAVTEHVGPYDGLPAAYVAVSEWMEAHGEVPGTGPYEVYIADMSTGATAEELRTEVVWPLA